MRAISMMAEPVDIIILNGEALDLDTTPLEDYFRQINWWPSFRKRFKRGYVARWELFGERLFLTGLFGRNWIVPPHLLGKLAPDPDPFEPAQDGVKSLRLQDLFPNQAPLVFAEWVTERLVVPIGPLIVYVQAGFGSLHTTYRTIDVVEGRVRSIRNWDGCEWARETGNDWMLDKSYQDYPQALVQPEQNAEGDEVEAEDDLGYWRDLDDPFERAFSYELSQEDALRKPCGQTPIE
jgi:hypothetical protein